MNRFQKGLTSLAAITLCLVSQGAGLLEAQEKANPVDWAQITQNDSCFNGERVQIKGYVLQEKGEIYLTAMAGGACCSSESCQNKIHLISADAKLANADSQTPVVVEGHMKEAGKGCSNGSCDHEHEKGCEGCLCENMGGCCALFDMEDPYLVDNDQASKTYTGGVITLILLGIAAVIGYQMVTRKKSS